MPAKKKPVKKRKPDKLIKLFPWQSVPKLNKPAIIADTKNTFEGEKWSEIFRIAKVNVPDIKPNWMAEVKYPRATSLFKLNSEIILFIIPLLANQSDVQQNCAITIMGNILFDFNIFLVTSTPLSHQKMFIDTWEHY